MKTHIVKNTREEFKESRTGNTVRRFMVTTWDLIDSDGCRLISEHRTKCEAVAAQQKAEGGIDTRSAV